MKETKVKVPKHLIPIFNLVDKLKLTKKQKDELKLTLAANKNLTGTRIKRRETTRKLKNMIK